MDTKVTVTFEFIIPASEIMDVDNSALRRFIKNNLTQEYNSNSDQFKFYSLEEFNPQIKEILVGTKKIFHV